MKSNKDFLNIKSGLLPDQGVNNRKNRIIQNPPFRNLVIGALMHSLKSSKNEGEIRQLKNINKYHLLTTINKENNFMDCSVGCYENNGRKFFIKTFEIDKKDSKNYFVLSEWFISNILYRTLKSQKSRISTPKPIEIISTAKSISLVYNFIDGKTLSLLPSSYQVKAFIQINNELNKISSLLVKEDIKLIPKRSVFFYLISLPYLSLLMFFKTGSSFKLAVKAFVMTLTMLLSQKINSKLVLAHRDLKPHNIIIKDSKIYLIDTGRAALTLPGYDLALLSLDPAYTSLAKSLEKKLKTFTNKFLKSYIAIQFAESNSIVGSKYLEFLKTEYANNTSSKKSTGRRYLFLEEVLSKLYLQIAKLRVLVGVDRSKVFPRGILAFRYFYHFLFSDFSHLGSRVTFKAGVSIENASHISLGDKVYLEKNVVLKFLEEFNGYGYKLPNLKIDDFVTVGIGTIIASASSIHIKKNALIGPYCFIGDHDHEYKDVTIPVSKQGYKNVEKIVIEEGAWIGANSTICSGVTLGKNAVIGANSVVTKNIPAFSVAVGSPAKVVKKFNTITGTWEKFPGARVIRSRSRNINQQKSNQPILRVVSN